MKKIFWTTIFWIVVFFGFAFYMKMFDVNMATGVSTWLGSTTTTSIGSTTITTSGDIVAATGTETDLMTQITTIQTTLTDMQTKLNALVGVTAPIVTPTPVVIMTGTASGTSTGN